MPACCAAAPGTVARAGAALPAATGARRPTASVASVAAWSCAWTDLHFALFLSYPPERSEGAAQINLLLTSFISTRAPRLLECGGRRRFGLCPFFPGRN